ncbi:hypothetical protein [Nocardioides sp. LML1-1-1.1]|uniref:hypothetical protein n=1 Tax=Nocardioides sp. LML1-1-1.1 TaxID=3135248 RepID=UPI003447B8F3
MRPGQWLARRRAERIQPDLDRAVPEIEDLHVTAVDRPAYRQGAEDMRTEILRILTREPEVTADGCHPVYHELGTHAPIGNARTVTP